MSAKVRQAGAGLDSRITNRIPRLLRLCWSAALSMREVTEAQGITDAATLSRYNSAAKALARVESLARDGGNLMPAIVDAVRSYCTLGEISDAMRKVFGEYRPEVML